MEYAGHNTLWDWRYGYDQCGNAYGTSQCINCGNDSSHFVTKHRQGTIVCRACGVVQVNRIMDDRSEWRTFADREGEDPCRVGQPMDDDFTGSATKIGNTGPEGSKLNRWQARISKPEHKCVREIKIICADRDLNDNIASCATRIFKAAQEHTSFRGTNQRAYMAASIYLACKHAGFPRTPEDVLRYVNVDDNGCNLKQLNRAISKMMQDILRDTPYYDRITQVVTPKELLVRMVYAVDEIPYPDPRERGPGSAPDKRSVIKTATNILNTIEEHPDICGKRPSKMAAAIIYFACAIQPEQALGKVTMDVICGELDVSLATVKEHVQRIARALDAHKKKGDQSRSA